MAGEQPRRRLAPEARRAQLIAVAEQVFVAHGYQGTAVEDIAAAAGVTRTLIYKYFADKDEIYLECLRAARDELDTAVVAAAGGAVSPEDQLRAGLGAYFRFVRDSGSTWDVLFGGGAAVAGRVAEAAAEQRYRTAEVIAGLVRTAAPHVDGEAASAYAHAISGAAEQLAKWWRRHPEVAVDVLVARMMDALWTGLRAIAEGDVSEGD
ncbi:TetR/AcrR family transcriptional regulator [Pimelobacter simplex]|uniref:TetR/AcrR family transcriptional regulator n=1 Tax=Nocardioides simplex TaxID=2045 RepID=A0A7J5DXJ2_NOCSI|nr:TetR/AcrR family transcriptional regulator [Pimelobacter simplex]KAB2810742.1 TetR/AcrR family transcriptional regulator [Pimelobacter simplex]